MNFIFIKKIVINFMCPTYSTRQIKKKNNFNNSFYTNLFIINYYYFIFY